MRIPANEESIVTIAECTTQTAQLAGRFKEVFRRQAEHLEALIYFPVHVISLVELQPLAVKGGLFWNRQSANYSWAKRQR